MYTTLGRSALIALCVAATAAAQTTTTTDENTRGHIVTSRYYHPSPGVFYHYGNFCGPQFPHFAANATHQQRIDQILSTVPVDSLDQACQAHDLCYEAVNSDEVGCDEMFADALGEAQVHRDNRDVVGPGGVVQHQFSLGMNIPMLHLGPQVNGVWQGPASVTTACSNLAFEMSAAVAMLKSRRSYAGQTHPMESAGEGAAGTLLTALAAPGHAADVAAYGFPAQPGTCVRARPFNYRQYGLPIG